VVIVDPETVENPGYQFPTNWTGKRRWAAECPENGAESNLGRGGTRINGEGGMTVVPVRHLPRISRSANPAQWEKA
jgi:hypothetical protein